MSQVLTELHMLRGPSSLFLSKKRNEAFPFEDQGLIEGLCRKHDAALFAFGNNSKKRPNNLIIGRTYNWQVLDMAEFAVEDFSSLEKFPAQHVIKGHKPLLLFQGEPFESSDVFVRLKNLFIGTRRVR